MVLAGRTNEQIKEFLVTRYGDFVLYRPPVQKNTYLLWLAPLLMFLVGAGVLGASIKKRSVLLETDQDLIDLVRKSSVENLIRKLKDTGDSQFTSAFEKADIKLLQKNLSITTTSISYSGKTTSTLWLKLSELP